MRIETGKRYFYAGLGEVYEVRVLQGVTNARGVVHGWKVLGDEVTGLPIVSKRDLFDEKEAATKAAFIKKLKGAKG